MFFIMGINDGQKELNYDSGGMNICSLACSLYLHSNGERNTMSKLRAAAVSLNLTKKREKP